MNIESKIEEIANSLYTEGYTANDREGLDYNEVNELLEEE